MKALIHKVLALETAKMLHVLRPRLLRPVRDENIKAEGCWPDRRGTRDHRTLLVLALAPGPWQSSPSLTTVPLIGSVDNGGTLNLHGNTLKTWIHLPPGKVLHPLCPAVAAHRKLRQKANTGSREDGKREECRGNICLGTREIGCKMSTALCSKKDGNRQRKSKGHRQKDTLCLL